MTNLPPGETGTPYARGVYKYSCPDHGTSYGHGYMELGGFFLEDDAVVICPEAEEGEWVQVVAAHCAIHGVWTEKDVLWHSFYDGLVTEGLWECPKTGHWFLTQEV